MSPIKENLRNLLFKRLDSSCDRTISCHPDIEKWCNANIGDPARTLLAEKPENWNDWKLSRYLKNVQMARYEIQSAVARSMREGEFSISTSRVMKQHGRSVYVMIAKFLKECPYVQQTRQHVTPGPGIVGRCRAYKIQVGNVILGDGKILQEDCDTKLPGSLPPDWKWAWKPMSPSLSIWPGCFCLAYVEGWRDVCVKEDWRIHCDFFGEAETTGFAFETAENASLDAFLDFSHVTDIDKLRHRKLFLRHITKRRPLLITRIKRNRMYHVLSNCPRDIRRKLSIEGERFAEVDMHASYWVSLVSRLRPDEVGRDKLVEMLQTGTFYSFFEEKFTGKLTQSFKVMFNTQCLFWPDSMGEAFRPLFRMLQDVCPGLCRLIRSVRRLRCGAGGVSDYVTFFESQAMFPAFRQLAVEKVPCITLHDAACVPTSKVDLALAILRACCEKAFGFVPLIRAKVA